MRTGAPSASSTATALLPIAEGGGIVGSSSPAAAERSSAGAGGDRSSDSSQGQTAGQPFAAALAGAQAGSAHGSASKAEASTAAVKSTSGASQQLTAAAEALLAARAGATVAVSDTASASPASVIAGDSPTAIEHDGQAAPAQANDDRDTTIGAGASGKPKTVKHPQSAAPTATLVDAGALSTIAVWLGASTAQNSATTRVSSAPVSSAQRSSGKDASVTSAAAVAVAVAAKQLPSRGSAADIAAATNSSNSPSALDRAMTASDFKGGSGDSSVAGAPAATANGASAGNALAPVMQTLSSVASSTAPNASAAIRVPVSDQNWPNAIAAQVQWMASRQVQSATLRLSPEHLGPLEVRIDVTQSQINVNFSAHHPDTREALAQAVPRLRELFTAGGLNLGEATVRQEARSSGAPLQPQAAGATPTAETVEPVANTAIQRIGLVDEYA